MGKLPVIEFSTGKRRKISQQSPENYLHQQPSEKDGKLRVVHLSSTAKNVENKITDDELPVDIIYNILSRMPLKSLARFQCVSKVWCKYINDPYLEIMHAKRGMKDPMMLIMFQLIRNKKPPHASASLNMLVTKKEEKKVIITKNPTLYMEFSSKYWRCKCITENVILGSCKDLILSSQPADCGGTVFLVINPLKKKECYKLPPIKIWSCASMYYEREACGLGFDDSTNTYKMVCVVLQNQEIMLSHNDDDDDDDDDDVSKDDLCTMVHVLGGGTNDSSSWRKINQVPPYPISGEGIYANGCLYWLVSYFLKYWPIRKIICFDIIKEEFGVINPPPNTLTTWCRDSLVDLDGQVGLVYNDMTFTCSLVEVWRLVNKTKWVIHCRFLKKPHLSRIEFIKVIGYWNKDTGDLLITDGCGRRLFIYRLKQGVLHETNFIHRKYACAIDFRLYQPTFSSILR